VVVVNSHTEAYDDLSRDAQRDELVALLGDPGCPVVVLGDLNATPDAVGMPAPYVDAWTEAGRDPLAGPTCGQAADLRNRTSSLSQRIDYVFVRDLDVLDAHVVGSDERDRTLPDRLWPSDHAGVVARLGF
jgi:endonuclease/exonuclease/phosphatase family metal-dependent hydrolase